jgi:glycosyltransferase involved in cell wall biosynthesis
MGFRLLEVRSLLNVPIALDLHGILKLQLQPLGKIARRKNFLKAVKDFLEARWDRYLILRSERSLFRLMDALIVRTEAEREYVAQTFHIADESIYVIPDGVDVDFLSEPASEVDKHALRAELGLQGKKVILWGGGFKAHGGMMDLVQAFQILNSQRSDVALVLIGDVNYLTIQVENFIREQGLSDVTLLGRQSRERFHVFQQTADVVITPEIKTAYNELAAPLKLLDCLGSGRPTVATRIRSHTSIIQDGVNGFLVEPQDPADIARGIARALNDSNAAEIGQRGRQTVIENHSWRRSAQYAVNTYADILQKRVHNRGSR